MKGGDSVSSSPIEVRLLADMLDSSGGMLAALQTCNSATADDTAACSCSDGGAGLHDGPVEHGDDAVRDDKAL